MVCEKSNTTIELCLKPGLCRFNPGKSDAIFVASKDNTGIGNESSLLLDHHGQFYVDQS